MRSVVGVARGWMRHRQVDRASLAVGAALVATLLACAWRIHVDRSQVPVAALSHGHRYLLGPVALLALVAGSLAGSIASWDVGSGALAPWMASPAPLGRSLVTWVLGGALGALVWFAALSLTVGVGAGSMLWAMGGAAPDLAVVGDALALVGRLGVLAAGLGAMGAALGLRWPASALPSVVPWLVVLGGEAAALVATDGRLQLVPFGSLGLVGVAGAQAPLAGSDVGATTVATVVAACWVVPVIVAGVAVSSVARRGLR